MSGIKTLIENISEDLEKGLSVFVIRNKYGVDKEFVENIMNFNEEDIGEVTIPESEYEVLLARSAALTRIEGLIDTTPRQTWLVRKISEIIYGEGN